MNNPYLEHPSEEALERFLLHRSEEEEVEVLETHILACESCITRLETLESELTSLKAALVAVQEERIQKELNPASSWKNWFTLPRLSWAGAACAALAVGLLVVPQSYHKLQVASNNGAGAAQGDLSACSDSSTDLTACRGSETATLPEGRPLNLRVATTDIPQGLVNVQLVNGKGSEIWQGQTTVNSERAEVKLPQIAQAGPYFLRFYSAGMGTEHTLLREFRFEVK